MKKALLILALVATTAQAGLESGPRDNYDMTKLMTTRSLISVFTVDEPIHQACNKERLKRGQLPFSYKVEACSFWSGNACQIYVGKKTNNDILGHELHHCFAGNFH
jgi:hypothetical protein